MPLCPATTVTARCLSFALSIHVFQLCVLDSHLAYAHPGSLPRSQFQRASLSTLTSRTLAPFVSFSTPLCTDSEMCTCAFSLSLSLSLCVCVCVCVLAVSDNLADERTRYTRCLPFTIFTRREQPHTRSHLLSRCPFCFLYLSSSWSCFPVTLARTLVIVFLCDPILSLMLSLFFVPP